jgi:hypothetical protein
MKPAPESADGKAAEPASQKNLPALAQLIHERSPELLRHAARDRALTEELALALLARRDLPGEVLEELARNVSVVKHRKVRIAVVTHPRTPRHVSLPIVRHLYNFELMQIALTPNALADLRMAVEEGLIARLESISAGERLSLAKRGSTRIAAALLLDAEARVTRAALDNPHMTEIWIVKALLDAGSPQHLVDATCRHAKWSLRRDVRVALLRNDKTPLARAISIANALPSMVLREVLANSRLAANVKDYLTRILLERPVGV